MLDRSKQFRNKISQKSGKIATKMLVRKMKQSKYTGNFGQQIEMETITIARTDILNTIFFLARRRPHPVTVDRRQW